MAALSRKLGEAVPMLEWLPDYGAQDARGDVQAGLTVGVMLIPQGIAYAVLAGVPAIYGLYASVVPLLVYPVFGSSRHLAAGVNAVSMIIVASGVGVLATPGTSEYVGLAILLTALVGVVTLAMGFARLGFLANLLARPVISGFTLAAALIIAASQLGNLLGLEIPRSSYVHVVLADVLAHLEQLHVLSLVLGLASLGVLATFQRWRPFFPAELLVLVLGTGAAALFGWAGEGMEVVGEVPTGLPTPELPGGNLAAVRDMWPTVITLALVQFMSVVSLGRVFSARHGYSIDANRELVAMGVSNILGSIFQALPSSGSFSRTTVNERSGARTPLANMVAAVVVGLTLLLLTPAFRYLPMPVLGAIIVSAAVGLVDLEELRELYRTKPSDIWVALFTFVSTLTLGIQEGILLGVSAAVLVILYRLSRPHVAELGHVPSTHRFHNLQRFPDAQRIPGLLVLRVEAGFSFFNADFFKEYILGRSKSERPVRAVVIDGSPINYLDSTAVDALVEVVATLEEGGIDIHFTGLKGPVRDVVENSGLAEELGEDHFHMSPHYAVVQILEQWDEEEGTGMLDIYERHRGRERKDVEPTEEAPYT